MTDFMWFCVTSFAFWVCSLVRRSVRDLFASYSFKPFISIWIISVPHSPHIPQTAPSEKNIYRYFRTIRLSNLKLGLQLCKLLWLKSGWICFQVLLDPDSERDAILSKVEAEVLAAFAEYVSCRSMVTLATCNSCRERPHWDMVCGEIIVPCCCLESIPCRVSSSVFQKWHSLAHWDVTQNEPSYPQGHEFHGVLHLAEWGTHASLFSLLLARSQHRMASYSSLALLFHPLSRRAWRASSKLRGSVCVFHGNLLYK